MIMYRLGVGILAIFLLICSARPQAQTLPNSEIDTATISATTGLTAARIKSKIDKIEARKDIDPAARDQALALYQKALSLLDDAETNSRAAATFQTAIQESPKQTAEIKEQLAVMLASAKGKTAELSKSIARLPLMAVEQRLDKTEGDIAKLKSKLNLLETRLRELALRPTAARTEEAAARKKLDELAVPRATGISEQPPLVAEARATSVAAERLAVSAKINLLEQELISLPAREALATASRDMVAAKLDILKKRLPVLKAQVNELRKSDALQKQAQADSVMRQLPGENPILEDYAKATFALREQRTDLIQSIEEAQSVLAKTNTEISRVRGSLTSAQQILEVGSVGEELGEYLRENRAQLPLLANVREEIHELEAAIVEARLLRLNMDQRRRTLSDPETVVQRLLSAADVGTAADRMDLPPTIKMLVEARRDALEQLSKTSALQIEQLAELNDAKRGLLGQAEQLNFLLNSKLLWLPSSAPLGWAWLKQIGSTISWLTNRESWKLTGQSLGRRIANSVVLSSVIFGLCGLLWGLRRRLREQLDRLADSVGTVTTDNLLLTPLALLITALIALPWPLLTGYLGWLLSRPPHPSEFTASVGNGLIAASFIFLVLRFLQLLCWPRGLLRVHFDWSECACQVLTRSLGRLMLVVIPTAFLMGMIEVSKSQIYRDGLGRLAFLAGAIAIAAFAFRALSPHGGILAARPSQREGAPWITRSIWCALLCLAPLALAALAITGYYDSASDLQVRLGMSLAIVILGLIGYGVAIREFLVARRRFEVLRAQERHNKALVAAAAQAETRASGDATPQILEDSEIDVAAISQQTRSLLRLLALVGLAVGLWLAWAELLPALGNLNEVSLWTQTISTDAGTKVVPVTLFNFLVGVAIAVITFMAARNLPGLLELTLLQKLAIEPGTRYAITAISRYVIIAVGLFIAFERIGADWSQLQWIVAALSVGVGFGLQEIVANFVSGLIILFERPVRVGDIVTIGDLSGTVSRIQIRATSITDWDNHEIIVPNKSLITDKVVNWTLSEPITRLLIKIGIAYGSDTALVQKVMLDTVKGNSLVLKNPPPTVFFLEFGDSSLNYEIRVFVAQPSQRLRVLHELHIALERALREHNIKIPFPQRDLHLEVADVAKGFRGTNVEAPHSKWYGARG